MEKLTSRSGKGIYHAAAETLWNLYIRHLRHNTEMYHKSYRKFAVDVVPACYF